MIAIALLYIELVIVAFIIAHMRYHLVLHNRKVVH